MNKAFGALALGTMTLAGCSTKSGNYFNTGYETPVYSPAPTLSSRDMGTGTTHKVYTIICGDTPKTGTAISADGRYITLLPSSRLHDGPVSEVLIVDQTNTHLDDMPGSMSQIQGDCPTGSNAYIGS